MPWPASRRPRAVSIVVVGHTDRLGTDGYNRQPSDGRAQSDNAYRGPNTNAESIVD